MAAVQFREMEKRRNAIARVQSNIRAFCFLKVWEWMKIMFKIKPLISQAEDNKKLVELEKNYEQCKIDLEKETKRRKELEEAQVGLVQVKFLSLIHLFFILHI